MHLLVLHPGIKLVPFKIKEIHKTGNGNNGQEFF